MTSNIPSTTGNLARYKNQQDKNQDNMMLSPALNKSSCSRRLLCLTAAAAFSTLPSSSFAFAPAAVKNTRYLDRRVVTGTPIAFLTMPSRPALVQPFVQSQTRLYASKKEGGGLFDKIKGAGKSILPQKWFQSDEEKQAAIQKKQMKSEISGGLQEILKDAPLPVRMMGKMVAPLMSSALSSMGQALKEQQQDMQDLMDDTRSYLVRDPDSAQALGEPIQLQPPFSQGSSTANINGKVTKQIQSSFYVQGAYQTGVARMTATERGISQLLLEVGGRTINVNLSSTGRSGSSSKFSSGDYKSKLGKNPKNQDDIIDVEFVEKK